MFNAAECVILIGLPASGKTTFYRERFAATHAHVSKDLLRNNRHADRRQEQLIVESLAHGHSVVVDNTNASIDVRAQLVALARAHGAQVIGYYFPTEASRCTASESRPDGDASAFQTSPSLPSASGSSRPAPKKGSTACLLCRLDESNGRFDVEPYSR